MSDYGRKAKDYSLRFQIIETNSEAAPGYIYVGVHQVGSSFAAYRATVGPDGTIYEMPSGYPPEARALVVEAQERVRALAYRRGAK